MRKLTSTKFFDHMKYQPGSWYQSPRGTWAIVVDVEEGSVTDEYDGIDRGWIHTLRMVSNEEAAEHERQIMAEQTRRQALTSDERIGEMMHDIQAIVPGLDWGN